MEMVLNPKWKTTATAFGEALTAILGCRRSNVTNIKKGDMLHR
uniref:Uncharacterized protein n=1 Tax=Anguilla anguilla TaxID=7936 RepID=A0A0E9WKY5_ANGAN